jgi:hypothetical protein
VHSRLILAESLSQAERALADASEMFAKNDDVVRATRLHEMADEVAATRASFVEETGGEPVRPTNPSKRTRWR